MTAAHEFLDLPWKEPKSPGQSRTSQNERIIPDTTLASFVSRRKFLELTLGFGATTVLGELSSYQSQQQTDPAQQSSYGRRNPVRTGALNVLRIATAEGVVPIGRKQLYRMWMYNGRYPGAEIRVREGDRIRAVVKNQLPEDTTIHWHGLAVPNPMDGVPIFTQKPIAPGEEFTYDFVASPAGTYMYHSHVGLQLDRGLLGPLIVEEKQPHISYDRDYVLVLDDLLADAPQALVSTAGGMMGGMMGGMRGGMGGMMRMKVPPYVALLINGHLPDDSAVFETKKGQRLRLRFVNPSGATTYRVAIAGHRMAITHTDGRPVRPFGVDAFYIGMGERYDVLVETNNPGLWPIVAAPVEIKLPSARALLRYTDSQARQPTVVEPEGIRSGRVLNLTDLHALEPLESRKPDQDFDFALWGGMMSQAWTINGQAYPQADIVQVHEGGRVRVRMTNHSMMIHPMHLHGHFFRVNDILKDTVIVPPHMGQVSFEFTADNPGRWFFHCHNIYHMESGMAREFRYV